MLLLFYFIFVVLSIIVEKKRGKTKEAKKGFYFPYPLVILVCRIISKGG